MTIPVAEKDPESLFLSVKFEDIFFYSDIQGK